MGSWHQLKTKKKSLRAGPWDHGSNERLKKKAQEAHILAPEISIVNMGPIPPN